MNTIYDAASLKQLPITQCRYCGGREFTVGYRHEQGMATFKRNGILGNRVKLLICKQCGIIQCSKVAEPERFPDAEAAWSIRKGSTSVK